MPSEIPAGHFKFSSEGELGNVDFDGANVARLFLSSDNQSRIDNATVDTNLCTALCKSVRLNLIGVPRHIWDIQDRVQSLIQNR